MPLTPKAAELYRAIVEHPESNALRREFADAVRAPYPAWADYIRSCLRRDEERYMSDPSEEVRTLLLAPFRKFGVGGNVRYGFIERIWVDPRQFIEHGAALLEMAPILEVHFSTMDDSKRGREFPMRELMASPSFRKVRSVSFRPSELFTRESMEVFFDCPYLDSLLALETPNASPSWSPGRICKTEDEERELWPRLFASPVFRRLIQCKMGRTWLKFGDRTEVSPSWLYEHYEYEKVTYIPMPPEDRELENEYGYIPTLHAGNWNADVLDVLRGKKPDFPVGAPPTEAMYAVPPPYERGTGRCFY